MGSPEQWVEGRLDGDAEEGGLVASLRQIDRLKRPRRALKDAVRTLAAGIPFDAVLVDLDAAFYANGGGRRQRGRGRIFSTFCRVT